MLSSLRVIALLLSRHSLSTYTLIWSPLDRYVPAKHQLPHAHPKRARPVSYSVESCFRMTFGAIIFRVLESLWECADYFDVPGLKRTCEVHFMRNITPKNVLQELSHRFARVFPEIAKKLKVYAVAHWVGTNKPSPPSVSIESLNVWIPLTG